MAATGYSIRPPSTTGDDGQPSNSLLRDVRRVFALMQDERILVAHALHQNVMSRLEEWKIHEKEQSAARRIRHFAARRTSVEEAEDHECRAANDILESKQQELDSLNVRCNGVNVFLLFYASFLFSTLLIHVTHRVTLYFIETRWSFSKGQNYTGTRRGLDKSTNSLWYHHLLSTGRRQ